MTYTATIDILDGLHEVSDMIKRDSAIPYNEAEMLKYFAEQAKAKYGDKYVRVSRIERDSHDQMNEVVYTYYDKSFGK